MLASGKHTIKTGVTEAGQPAGVTAPKAQPLPPLRGTLPKGEGLRLRRKTINYCCFCICESSEVADLPWHKAMAMASAASSGLGIAFK